MVSLLKQSRDESRAFYLTDILAPGAADVLTVPRVILFSSTPTKSPRFMLLFMQQEATRLILQRLRAPLSWRRLNGKFVALLDEIRTR